MSGRSLGALQYVGARLALALLTAIVLYVGKTSRYFSICRGEACPRLANKSRIFGGSSIGAFWRYSPGTWHYMLPELSNRSYNQQHKGDDEQRETDKSCDER
jgi:hypothetical protein